MKIKVLGLVGASAIVVGALLLASLDAVAQTEAETVEFLLPAGTPVFDFSSFKAVVTSPSRGTTSAGTCGNGDGWHIQEIVLIPGSGNAATRVDAILLRTEPLRPGTKLINLEPIGSCIGSGGEPYDKVRGTVTTGPEPQQAADERVITDLPPPQATCGCAEAE